MANNQDDDEWGWHESESASSYVYVPVEKFVDVDKNTVKVDQTKVGSIIGSRGSMIRELQEDSRAKIVIGKEEDRYTFIKIQGSDAQIQKAKKLIEDLLTKPPMSKKEREYMRTRGEKTIELRTSKAQALLRNEFQYLVNDVEDSTNTRIDFGKISKYGDTMDVTIKGKLPDIDEACRQLEAIDLGRDIDPLPTQEELWALADKKEADKWAKVPKIVKNVYKEDPRVARLSTEEVERIRKANNDTAVSVVEFDAQALADAPVKIPNPVTSFREAFHSYPDILKELDKLGFSKPSPIQAQAWPVLMSGHDMIGIAQTGTGKTFAFLLPALVHTAVQPTPLQDRKGPNVLILAPTRELATQIEKEVNKINYKGMTAVCVYGGKDIKDQLDKLKRGCQVLIATPGRLNDFISRAAINLEYVTYVVLDEADRMLDMGFEPQINIMAVRVNPQRQTVMTSATWNNSVQRVAKKYMVNPIKVNVGSLDLAATHTVTQRIIFLDSDDDKWFWLREFIDSMNEESDKIMVFMSRKATVSHMASELACAGIRCCSLHSDLCQEERESSIDDIQTGYCKILVATDVASRGLDVPNLSHVINFDFPLHIEEYVHRVGRTGRAGNFGESITLMTRADWKHADKLIPILEEANQEVPQELRDMAERYKQKMLSEENGGGGGFRGRGGGGGRGRGRGRGGGGRFGGRRGRDNGGRFGGGGDWH